MTTVQSDIVIVGARCAGATLATLLARRGLRVLVLDSGAEGTGQALSTHFLQPPATSSNIATRFSVIWRWRWGASPVVSWRWPLMLILTPTLLHSVP